MNMREYEARRTPSVFPILGKGRNKTMRLLHMGLPRWLSDKSLPAKVGDPWVPSLGQEDAWRREYQSTPVFLPGESHGQRNLVVYSAGDHRVIRN